MNEVDICLSCTRADCTGDCDRVADSGGRPKRDAKLYYCDGEWLTLYQIAKRKNISVTGLYCRVMTMGWPLARALSTPVAVYRAYGSLTVAGEHVTYRQLAAMLGVTPGTIARRVGQGWDGDRIYEHYRARVRR